MLQLAVTRRRISAIVVCSIIATLMVGHYLPPLDEVLPSWANRWASEMFSTGGIVYREQRTFFEDAARRYQLHWYWQLKGLTEQHVTFDELVMKRLQVWVEHLHQFGRDDFKIEKDKCALINCFRMNDIPTSSVLGQWTSNDTLIEDLRSGKALEGNSVWPVFLKCCHLTAGSAMSVAKLSKDGSWMAPSLDSVQTKGLEAWINQMWLLKPDDELRSWRREHNMLTDTIPPGFIMQTPAFSGKASAMEEVRIEVIWGRALNANWKNVCIAIPTEDRTDAEVHDGVGLGSIFAIHRWGPASLQSRCTTWMAKPGAGYFACAFALAERTALTMAADYVRVDIFISKDSPKDCMVNEISLSSGYPRWGYDPGLVKLWRDPHIQGLYHTWGNVSSKPIYKQLAADVPVTPLQELLLESEAEGRASGLRGSSSGLQSPMGWILCLLLLGGFLVKFCAFATAGRVDPGKGN
ncbi:unnamed protein product [Polarella glacialis]|uniref:Uncharacterized protein n=1 Tax=Polarella glacialis TaxID=89957 RepID=A0A813DT89_POLGL|nr:unnamed protein product [Polarella glacialis]